MAESTSMLTPTCQSKLRCSCRNGEFCPPVPMHNSTPSATGTAGANATLSLLNLHTPLPFNSDLASPSRLGAKTPSHRTGTVVSDDSTRSGEEGRQLGVGTKQHQAQAHLAPVKKVAVSYITETRQGSGPIVSPTACLWPGTTYKLPENTQWMLRL